MLLLNAKKANGHGFSVKAPMSSVSRFRTANKQKRPVVGLFCYKEKN